MSFARQRFLGLTIVDFTANIGWNDAGSSVTIKLAPEDGESIGFFNIGDPVNFSFGSFVFNGFIERAIINVDNGGKNLEVTLSDGKEILRNVEVITQSFYGWKEPLYDCLVTNLLNPYRFFEAQSFGGSLSDDSGMLLSKFCEGVNATAANCGLIHRGNKFSIDISNLAGILPAFYRISGPSVNLLDAISTICEDAGYNYYIDRIGYTFYVRLASLNVGIQNQGVNTLIAEKAKERNSISYKYGAENASNVVSNYVLYGGNHEESLITIDAQDPLFPNFNTISSFWGYHPISNVPIKGYGAQFNVLTGIGGQILYPVEFLEIPTLGVEDIIADTIYVTNTLELQLVIGGKETWELWLEMYKQGAYQQIFGRPPRPLSYLSRLMTGGAAESNITREFVAGENDIGVIRGGRIYDWLKSMADGFFGKQFLVRLGYPLGVRDKLEGYYDQYDPQKIHYNYSPTDSGHFQNSDGNIIGFGLNEYGDAAARNDDGKIVNFAFFNTPYLSYAVAASQDKLVSGSLFGLKVTVADKWVWWGGQPHFHLTLNEPAFELQDRNLTPRCQPVGGLTEECGYPQVIQVLFGIAYNTNAGSSLKFKVGPLPLYPIFTLTCVKSENYFYGPWISKYGNGGKTKFEQDSSVTPWTYGSREKMGEISLQRVRDEIGYVEDVETGQYTKLGLPEYSLGDELVSEGPRLTGISVSYGASGVNTNYTVSTYTPRFGFLPKQTIDNVKRLAQKSNIISKMMLKQLFDVQRAVLSAARVFSGRGLRNISFNITLGRRHDRSTPHGVLLLQSYNPKELYNNNNLPDKLKTIGGFTTIGEAAKDIGPIQGDDGRPNRSVAGSIDQIFRPFANATNTGGIPRITLPLTELRDQISDDYKNSHIPTSISYNPLKVNNDIDLVMTDDGQISSWDHHNFPNNYTSNNTVLDAKGIAFKGPMMLTGWGTAITGPDRLGSVPNANFPWKEGQSFRAGPIDLMWDEVRGVWTSHDVVLCKNAAIIPGVDSLAEDDPALFGVGEANIYAGRNNAPSNEIIPIVNIGKKDIPANTHFLAKYDVYNNQWVADHNEEERYRFWEECASNEEYWDFDIQKDVDDPGYGDVDEGYCTDVLNKVTVVKTNGYTGSYEVVIGLIECEDSVLPEMSELKFHHGLFKEAIALVPDECPENTTTTVAPTTTTVPPTCLYYDSVAICYTCRRCDTPPDGNNWQHINQETEYTVDSCATVAEGLGTSCTTTTIAPGCYLVPVTGTDASSCYQCIPASSYDADDPTYEDPGTFYAECDECNQDATVINETSPECNYSVCLYQDPANEFCYICSDCDSPGSIGNFTGVDADENCFEARAAISAIACLPTTTTTPAPDICLYHVEDAEISLNCFVCQRCDTPPDNSSLYNNTIYETVDSCNAALPVGETVCPTTTLPPGCRKRIEDGCYTCVPEADSGGIGAYFGDCDDCQQAANVDNEALESCTTTGWCLYQDPNNPLCYFCAECNPNITGSIGSFYGATAADDCEQSAALKEPASCNTTTTTTTAAPTTTTPNPNCTQVVSGITCGESGLTVTYVNVASCGVPQVYQTDFQTVILRAEMKSLKRQLSDIYNALEKHGIKINNA